MRIHRLAHATRYWQPIVTEWPRPPGIALTMPSAIHLGWMTTLEGGPKDRAKGAGITWRIDLVLGFMAIPGETPAGSSHGVACLLLRPLIGPALDLTQLGAAYRAWHKAKHAAWERGEDGPSVTTTASLAELLLEPPTGPSLTCESTQDEQATWRTVTEAWEEADRYRAAAIESDEATRPMSKLLQDLPYLLAFEDRPQHLWDPAHPHAKPTMDSCAERVPALEPATGRGRPRSFAPMNTAMAITDALVHLEDDAPPAELEAYDERLVDMRALFALELVLEDETTDTIEQARTHNWLLGGHERSHTPADLRRRSMDLRKKLDNWHTACTTGRRDSTVGAYEVRKIVPTLIFDRSVFLKPSGPGDPDPLENIDAVLVDWLRSPRVEELMDIVTGRRRHLLNMRCTPGGFDGFMAQRGLPFHRTKVIFRPDEDGYRGAVAMTPGAQPGEPLVLDLTGFAKDPDELIRRCLGRPLGTVLSTCTVPAGQPWPPLVSSMTSPPPSSLGT